VKILGKFVSTEIWGSGLEWVGEAGSLWVGGENINGVPS